MTLRVRNRFILYSALAVLFTALVLTGVMMYEMWFHGGMTGLLDMLPALHSAETLYGLRVPGSATSRNFIPLSVLIPVPIAVGAALLTRRYFRSSITPTIFFVTMSMILSGLSGIRILQVLLPVYDFPSTYAATVSRTVYALHIAGALSLFTASMYAAGAQYTRIWGALIAVGTTAMAFAYVLPVDAFQLDQMLLHRVASRGNAQLITGVLALLTLVNFLRYAVEAEESGRAFVPLALCAILVSREILFYVSGLPLHLLAAGMNVTGFALFARNSYAVYLWS
ncbi:MAG: hypothetical protein ACOC4I_07185 [Spirochaetota bacterium]